MNNLFIRQYYLGTKDIIRWPNTFETAYVYFNRVISVKTSRVRKG